MPGAGREAGDMEMIDAQIHNVEPVKTWDASFTEDQALTASAELAVASLDAVGVAAAIINWYPRYLDAYLGRYPERFAGLRFFAHPRFPDPPDVEAHIAELADTPGIVATRFALNKLNASDDQAPVRLERLRGGGYDAYFSASQRYRLPICFQTLGFLPYLHHTIRSFPEATFVIDHLGLRPPSLAHSTGTELFDDVSDVLALAQFPNVAVKFTGVPALSMRPYPFEDVWPRIHPIIDAFGVDRLMWGTDFTRCKRLHNYREGVDFLRLTDELSESDKQMLFSGSIRRWLRWPNGLAS